MKLSKETLMHIVDSIEDRYIAYIKEGHSHELAIAYTALVAEEEIGYHGIFEAFAIWTKKFENKKD